MCSLLVAQRSQTPALLRECLSVRLSVCHTCESRLNDSRYRNMLCSIQRNNFSSFLRQNFAILHLGAHPEQVRQRGISCRERKKWQILRDVLETMRDGT